MLKNTGSRSSNEHICWCSQSAMIVKWGPLGFGPLVRENKQFQYVNTGVGYHINHFPQLSDIDYTMNRYSPISNTVLRTITKPKKINKCSNIPVLVIVSDSVGGLWKSCTQKCLPVMKPNICVQTVSKVEWEMSLSWSLRVPTDVNLSGEAKMDNLTQQQLGVKAKSQCFQESPAPKSIKFPQAQHWKKKYIQTHPDVFTSSDYRDLCSG